MTRGAEALTESFMVCSGGPAFIPWSNPELGVEVDQNVVSYVWQPATDCTMAGWVLRKKSAIPEAVQRELKNSGSQDDKR
jgi:hypothetical protein